MNVVSNHLHTAVLDCEYPVGLVALAKQTFASLKDTLSCSGRYFIWNPVNSAHRSAPWVVATQLGGNRH